MCKLKYISEQERVTDCAPLTGDLTKEGISKKFKVADRPLDSSKRPDD